MGNDVLYKKIFWRVLRRRLLNSFITPWWDPTSNAPSKVNCSHLKVDIHHWERIQKAATRWVKGSRGPKYEKWLKVIKVPPIENKSLRNGLVQTHRILFGKIDLEETQLFKFYQGQCQEDLHWGCFIKPGKSEEKRSVLHTWSLGIGTFATCSLYRSDSCGYTYALLLH